MLAAVGDTPYNIVRLVHLFTVIVGTGLAFAAPVIAVRARRGGGGKPMQELVDETASALIFPMLLVAGMAGGALVGMSDDFWDFSQTWLAIGGAVWMLILVLVLAVYPPRWLSLFNLAEERKRMLGGMLHLALAVMLVLMVWKFGALPGAY
jgi:hypothetical protein